MPRSNCVWSFLPGSDPRFRMHLKSSSPESMLLWSWWEEPSLCSQLLCYSSDMVGLKSTTATDIANSSIVSLPCIFMDVPAGHCSGLKRWEESKVLRLCFMLNQKQWHTNNFPHPAVFKVNGHTLTVNPTCQLFSKHVPLEEDNISA